MLPDHIRYVFQMSGMRDLQQKADLLQAIRQLGGQYVGGSVYKEAMTHLIITKPLASEKFLAACAGGKWIVTPQFVLESVKHKAWLPEAPYELNFTANSNAHVIANPLQKWREGVARGVMSGAFQDWVVYLEIEDHVRRAMFERILKAGKAVVCTDRSATQTITHVLTKAQSHTTRKLTAPYYSITYIAEHLFGALCSGLNCSINLNKVSQQASCVHLEVTECTSITLEDESMDVSDNSFLVLLEETLTDYVTRMEVQKRKLLQVPGFYANYNPVFSIKLPAVDFSNVQSIVECGLFPQALEEVQSCLHPGVCPPASVLQECMQHALQGEAEPYFLNLFSIVLNDILRNNPTWHCPASVKYFSKILQCPECEAGVWPFLQTSLRFCLGSTETCHSLPSPASTDLLRFHGKLQAFVLRLFQLELHCMASSGQAAGSQSSVLYSMFWGKTWKSKLSSKALQQLADLLVETTLWALHSSQEWRLRVLGTLQEILAVVVEYWALEHTRLNSQIVQNGFQDFAEYMAILCQGAMKVLGIIIIFFFRLLPLGVATVDHTSPHYPVLYICLFHPNYLHLFPHHVHEDLHPDILRELVPALPSHRLRMLTADAIYRNICTRNGLIIRSEPLSLHKIVFTYLRALGQLCGCKSRHSSEQLTERTVSSSTDSQDAGEKECVGGSGSVKDNMPKGFRRVNIAGETPLHQACKRNQLEKVLQILSLPGVDANVKDHAGWTPLHEACNHGSGECVRALLQHCPNLQLDSQVKGVSPLHDALLNQHTDIAKMLLRHAGSVLLDVRDDGGNTPLDLVSCAATRDELVSCAQERDATLATQISEVRDLAFLESCSCLFSCLLLTYLAEQYIPSYETAGSALELSPSTAQTLLRLNSETLSTHLGNSKIGVLARDLRTLMSMEQYVLQMSPALTHCQGTHTSLLIQLLKDLQAEGTALLEGHAGL